MQVFINILDGIHHYIFHIFECGLRDIGDNKTDDNNVENCKQQDDEYYDPDFSRMSARIASTRNNTKRFNRINASNKFTIKTDSDDTRDIAYNNGAEGETTYLDSVYINLEDNGIEEEVIEHLATYAVKEAFDTEAMDWDRQIVGGGNIENEIKDSNCTMFIKPMFQKTTSMFL